MTALPPAAIATIVAAAIGVVGVIVGAALVHSRETKRDRASAIMQHVEILQTRLRDSETRQASMQGEIDRLWTARRADAVLIRAQGDHIDVLEAHIWARREPPPPARPQGA
ncbi:hypothetical protein [Ruania rhizosphaerae]|uniref:hypothetical protein n=1 Tax=Ruania rhizosphaerae TaxID=1840413 RepID=UPI00135C4A0B|nr:hypothetical protein [Ruania rhizosphaerae]